MKTTCVNTQKKEVASAVVVVPGMTNTNQMQIQVCRSGETSRWKIEEKVVLPVDRRRTLSR